MQQPHPHFSLAGIPIRIEWSFWLIAVFLGYGAREGWLLVAWVAIVLVSILVHELGHAFALKAYRQRPSVTLHAFGGLTYGSAPHRSRTESIVVSAAGPLTAFLLLGVPAYIYLQSFSALDAFFQPDRYVIVQDIAWVNIAWSIVNLLPILPLDGGNIAQSIIGRPATRIVSMAVAVAGATYFFTTENQFGGVFLMLFAFMNFASYQQEKAGSQPSVPTPATRIEPPRGPRPSEERDNFAAGAQALEHGMIDEGVRLLVAAYTAQPSGPTSLGTAQSVARAGAAPALATALLTAKAAGPTAAASLQSHLHYANCFRESAEVGVLVHRDGRASRAQTAFDVACSLARSGDNDGAVLWLRQAIVDGFTAGALLDGEPDLATLRLRPDWPEIRALAG